MTMPFFPLRQLTVGVLLLAACSDRDPPPPPPVPVIVATAERRSVPFELAATGQVEPLQTVAVQSQVEGTLRRIAFTEGAEVQRGQVLFELTLGPTGPHWIRRLLRWSGTAPRRQTQPRKRAATRL